MPRLFIAVPIDESVKANLERVGTAANARGVSWVPPENMHLTLAFLGEVEERRVPELEDAMYAATDSNLEPLHLRAQGLGAFPDEEKVRVLWAGLDGQVPELVELQARLMRHLRSAGFEVDSKKFRPHITLARFRWPQPMPKRLARLQEFGEWEAAELQLIESHLYPTGARYVVRADVPLLDDG
jgi:2'-5' RNA ligase